MLVSAENFHLPYTYMMQGRARVRVRARARVRVNALALDHVEHHRRLEELLALVLDYQLLDRGRLAVLVVHGDGPLGKRPARLFLLLP